MAINCCSYIKENGKKINYMTYIRSMRNEECNGDIVRMIDKIEMDKINRFIDYMSDVRK